MWILWGKYVLRFAIVNIPVITPPHKKWRARAYLCRFSLLHFASNFFCLSPVVRSNSSEAVEAELPAEASWDGTSINLGGRLQGIRWQG